MMSEHPLEIIKEMDPEFAQLFENTSKLALEEGGIPRKYKFLMAMALDASQGAVRGVRNLAEQAMQEGATKEEIMEAIRIAQYIAGAGSVYTAADAFRDMF